MEFKVGYPVPPNMGVATGGASRGRAPPFRLSGGAGPPNFFTGSDNPSDSQRARNLRTGLSKAGMSLIYQLANRLQDTEADLEPTEIRVGSSVFELQFSD